MGRINLNSYLVNLYKPRIRSRRWYIYIFFHSLYLALVNALLLYRRHLVQLDAESAKQMALKEFVWTVSTGPLELDRSRGRLQKLDLLPGDR